MQQLIEDLLSLSRLESQPKRQDAGRADLAATLDRVLTTVNQLAREKGVALEKEIPAEIPELAISESYLNQVLLNLIDNGIKYTPAGGRVTIRAARLGELVQVEVADTGIGIPPRAFPAYLNDSTG